MNDCDKKSFLLIIINILIYIPLIILGIVGGSYTFTYLLELIYGDHNLQTNYFNDFFAYIKNIGKYELMLCGGFILFFYGLKYYYDHLIKYDITVMHILLIVFIFLSMVLVRLHFLNPEAINKLNPNSDAFDYFSGDDKKQEWLKNLWPIFKTILITIFTIGIVKYLIYQLIQYYFTRGLSSSILLISIIMTSLVLIGIILNMKIVQDLIRNYMPNIFDIKLGEADLFTLITKFMNSITNTPKNTLYFLLFELIVISLFYGISYMLIILYKLTLRDDNVSQLYSNNLLGIEQAMTVIDNNLNNMYSYQNPRNIKIPISAWDIIIQKNLYIKDDNDPIKDRNYYRKLLNFLTIENKYIKTNDERPNNISVEEWKQYSDEFIQNIRNKAPEIIKLRDTFKSLVNEQNLYMKKNIKSNILNQGVILQKEPIILNKTSQPLTNKLNNIDFKSHNFCVSCWINIHSFPSNTNKKYNIDTNILNLGNHMILYNAKSNKLIFKMNNGDKFNEWNVLEVNYKTFEYYKLKLQKWNNIVLNYVNGTLDIFINGKLIESMQNNMTLLKHDDIYYGEDNGIYGYIKLITYWPTHLSAKRIKLNYHTI